MDRSINCVPHNSVNSVERKLADGVQRFLLLLRLLWERLRRIAVAIDELVATDKQRITLGIASTDQPGMHAKPGVLWERKM
jgi:hypothetical protein